MARLSDVIEEFIKSLLKESEGQLELQRNELADFLNVLLPRLIMSWLRGSP